MRRALRSWWQDGEQWHLAVGLANLVLGTASVLIPLAVADVYGRSAGAVGLLASLVSLVGVAGSLLWGRLSDAAHRRKPFIVLSYAAVGLCFLAISFATSFGQLALFNMLMNFFWIANSSVAVLIVIENRDPETWERRIGHLNQFGAIGWVAGLALGSLWTAILSGSIGDAATIRWLFVTIGLASLAASFLAFRFVPRTIARFTHRRFRGAVVALGNFIVERARFAPLHLYHRLNPRRIGRLLTRPEGFRPGTRRFLLSTLLTFTGLGLFGIPLPLVLVERFGFPSSTVFLLFMIQHLGIVFAYPLASRRIRRLGNRSVQAAAVALRFLLFAGAAGYLFASPRVPSMAILVAAFVLYGATWSYFQLSGVALTSRLAREENRGAALGLYNALAGLGWILAGLGSGWLSEWGGYGAAFSAAAALLALSLVVLRTVPDPVKTTGKDASPRPMTPRTEPRLSRRHPVIAWATHRR